MDDHPNRIEAEIIQLIKEYEEREFISERDTLVSDLIVQIYNSLPGQEQIQFKDLVAELLYKYLNTDGKFADAVIYHLLQVVSMIKIPLGNLLTDILRSETLIDRYFDDRELNLEILTTLTELPISYRTKTVLSNLIKRPNYKNRVVYNLHFLEFFVNKEMTDDVESCLDNLVALRISDDSDVDLIGFQLYSSFPDLSPEVLRNWYVRKLKKNSEVLKENLFNKSLLVFVEDARAAKKYYRDNWNYTFNLIGSFAEIYTVFANQPEIKTSDILTVIGDNNVAYDESDRLDLDDDKIKQLIDRACMLLEVSNNNEKSFRSADEYCGKGTALIAKLQRNERAELAIAAGTG